MKILFTGFAIVLLSFTLHGQSKKLTVDSEKGLELYNQARDAFYSGDIEGSKRLIDKSLVVFSKTKTRYDSTNYEYITQQFGDFYKYREQYLIALELYKRGNELAKEVYWAEKDFHINQGRYEYRYGECFANLGYPTIAIEHFEKALIHFKTTEWQESIAATYSALATGFEALKNYDQASVYFNKSLNEYIRVGESQSIGVAILYNNMGVLENTLENFDKAIENFNNSIDLYGLLIQEEKEEDKKKAIAKKLIVPIYNIAGAYIELDDYEKVNLYIKSLDEVELYEEDYEILTANLYNFKSKYFAHQNILDSAIYYANLNIDKTKEVYVGNKLELAKSNLQLADIYMEIGKYKEALYVLQKVLTLNVFEFEEDDDISKNPSLGNIPNNTLYRTVVAKAECLEKLYDDTQDPKYLEYGLELYTELDKLVNNFRQEFVLKTNNIELSKYANKMYHGAVASSYKYWQITQAESDKRKIYYYASKLKSAALANIVSNLEDKKISGISEDLLQRERALDVAITFYNTEIQKESIKEKAERNLDQLMKYRDTLFLLNNSRNELLTSFKQDYPRYIDLKHNAKSVSIETLQANLNPVSAILDYTYDEEAIYLMLITKSRFEIEKITFDKAFLLESAVAELRTVINKRTLFQNENKLTFIENSHQLYNYLIEPIQDKLQYIEQLYILGEGVLHYLPFEVLLANTTERLFDKMPYLIKDYEITYHYSPYLLSQTLHEKKESTLKSLLAFAPVFDKNNKRNKPGFTQRGVNKEEELAPLYWSEKEIKHIKKRFLENKGNVVMLSRAEANESEFKKALASTAFSHVHISSHGFANAKNPDLSCIVCADDNTTNEDNLLNAIEIYNFRISAELVVLSSCESGIGKLQAGEGMISLNRGFLYAGADNVLYSLWQVSDLYTFELMTRFYDNIFDNEKDYGSALRKAKLEMIAKSPVMAQPTYWSGFVLLGN